MSNLNQISKMHWGLGSVLPAGECDNRRSTHYYQSDYNDYETDD